MIKIYLTNDVTNQLDLSDYIVDIGKLNRKVESEKPGEAGLVVFDKVTVEFPLSVFPNNDFDPDNLDNYGRYIVSISLLFSQERKIFEGLVDKSTVEYTAANTVRFDVVDKIAALALLANENARQQVDVAARINDPNVEYLWIEKATDDPGYSDRVLVEIVGAADQEGGQAANYFSINTPFYVGEIFYSAGNYYLVREYVGTGTLYDVTSARYYLHNITVPNDYEFSDPTYESDYYGIDIRRLDNDLLVNYNGYKIAEALIKQQWPGINVIRKTQNEYYDISLDYYPLLIFDRPFDKDTLEALKYLIRTMRIYLFINTNGDVVIQEMTGVAQTSDTLTIDGNYDVENWTKKYQWDKLVDYVFVKDPDKYDPNDSSTYGEAPTNMNYQPRNKLERDVLKDQADSLQTIANDYYDFYGTRRQAAQIDIKLDENNVDVDLLYKIVYLGADWFLERMGMDLVGRKLILNLVEL